jgi:hypothetical protein
MRSERFGVHSVDHPSSVIRIDASFFGGVMSETILVGHRKQISSIPRSDWERELDDAPELIRRRLDFMSPDHHAVRNFVVREMPIRGQPISVDQISRALQLPVERTAGIVEDLEENLFFLARRKGPEVTWAFPVTIDQTPHHLVFSTGERLDAA